jgi:hypothetical protein
MEDVVVEELRFPWELPELAVADLWDPWPTSKYVFGAV